MRAVFQEVWRQGSNTWKGAAVLLRDPMGGAHSHSRAATSFASTHHGGGAGSRAGHDARLGL